MMRGLGELVSANFSKDQKSFKPYFTFKNNVLSNRVLFLAHPVQGIILGQQTADCGLYAQ